MTEISNRVILCTAVSFALVALFFVFREHWGHALGLLPYALLMAGPLPHLLHGHGSRAADTEHRHHTDPREARRDHNTGS